MKHYTTLTDELFLADMANTLKTKLKLVQGDSVRALAFEADAQGVQGLWQFAHVLGTCWHESRLIPQKEKRARKGTQVWEMQEKYWHTGFYGHGLIQLTHERNFAKFGKMRGKDYVGNPELVLDVNESAFIAVKGMKDGLFTGKKLSDYIAPDETVLNMALLEGIIERPAFPFITESGRVRNANVRTPQRTPEFDFAHKLFYARRIVNGTFHAIHVARATVKIYKCLAHSFARAEHAV